MSSSSRFIVLVLSLVFLLTSVSGFGFSAKKLAHDLEHHDQPHSLTIDHAPSDFFVPESVGLAIDNVDASVAEFEHHLLHTVGTVQLFTLVIANIAWATVKHILTPLTYTHSLPVALLEAPFRPPRTSSSI